MPASGSSHLKDLKEASDLLEEHIQMRMLPRPPSSLLERPLGESNAGGGDGHLRAVVRLVAPHWNQAVRMLNLENTDGTSYLALVQLRDRLRQKVEGVDADLVPLERSEAALYRVVEAIGTEVDQHGPDTPIRSTLNSGVCRLSGAWWYWEELESGGAHTLHFDGSGESWEAEMDAHMAARKAYSHETWRDVYERAAEILARLEEAQGPLVRKRDVLGFRLSVIEQVLDEYDALGFVGLLDAVAAGRSVASPDISHYKPDELLFIVVAAEVLEEDPKREIMSTGIFTRIDNEILILKEERPGGLGKIGWSYPGKALRVAERRSIAAYQTTREEGTRPGDEVDKRRKLEERVRELAQELSEAGVKTVDKVIDFAD